MDNTLKTKMLRRLRKKRGLGGGAAVETIDGMVITVSGHPTTIDTTAMFDLGPYLQRSAIQRDVRKSLRKWKLHKAATGKLGDGAHIRVVSGRDVDFLTEDAIKAAFAKIRAGR